MDGGPHETKIVYRNHLLDQGVQSNNVLDSFNKPYTLSNLRCRMTIGWDTASSFEVTWLIALVRDGENDGFIVDPNEPNLENFYQPQEQVLLWGFETRLVGQNWPITIDECFDATLDVMTGDEIFLIVLPGADCDLTFGVEYTVWNT